MRCVFVILTILSSGCLIVPKTVVKKREVSSRATTTPLERGQLKMSAKVRGKRLVVTARYPRVCLHKTEEFVKITEQLEADIVVGGAEDPQLLPFVMVIAPLTGALSGIVTIIALLADDGPTVTEKATGVNTERAACPVPASNVLVRLSLPSGAALEGKTDKNGSLTFTVPETEAPGGTVVASVAGLGSKSFLYGTKAIPLSRQEVQEGLRTVRQAVVNCGMASRMSNTHMLTIAIEMGNTILASRSRLPHSFANCAEHALRQASFRAAPRLKVRYPYHFGSQAARDVRIKHVSDIKNCRPLWAKRREAQSRKAQHRAYIAMSKTCRTLYWEDLECKVAAEKTRIDSAKGKLPATCSDFL